MLCGARPSDEGLYECEVSAGSNSERSQSCEVRLLADVEAKRASADLPLQRAAEAQAHGDLAAAAAFFGEAATFGQTDGARADALSKSASLLLQLGRWADAFRDASEAAKLSPGLVAAHVVRGRAATELGQLAEAVSSWETAELLGGVPDAAQQAEACRQRLQQFFAEQQEKRRAGFAHAGTGGFTDKANDDDPEASWQRNGWHGRSAGEASGGFFGSDNRSGTGAGSKHNYRNFLPQRSSELQRHLGILGIGVDAKEPLPCADTVRTAYRRLALQAHPDKPGGSKVAFQELQNAYEAVLSAIAA